MKSLYFWSPNFVNSEPIEQNSNGIFVNEQCKIWFWLRNYDKLQKITNSLISVFHPVMSICLYSVKFESIQFICSWFWLVQNMTKRYSVPLKYLVNSNSHLNFEFEGKIKFIADTWVMPQLDSIVIIYDRNMFIEATLYPEMFE